MYHLIHLLELHKYYEIGLAPATPELELYVKSVERAMLRSRPHHADGEMTEGWGPRYVLSSDKAWTLWLFLDFERHWESIAVEDRTKSHVIRFLTQLLAVG